MVQMPKMATTLVEDSLFNKEWENIDHPLAPLTALQNDALFDLSEELNRPPIIRNLATGGDLGVVDILQPADKEVTKTSSEREQALQQIENKIKTKAQFLSWFDNVEKGLLEADYWEYTDYMAQLDEHRQECSKLLSEVEAALSKLNELTEQYRVVSDSTRAVHDFSQQLLADQTKLQEIFEEVNNRLKYFTAIESMSKRLSSPALSVSSESFFSILDQLDECMSYIEKHGSWKESSVYMVKYRHCLSRAVSLVQTYITDTFQSATQQVLSQPVSPEDRETALTLCYGKFQASAPRVKAVIRHIEERANKRQEYELLLADCHQAYFSQRERLLSTSMVSAITELAQANHGDHCSLVRSGCAFLVHICQDEHQLFYQFFGQSTPLLTTYLESLCTSLYDVLRPFIIHINHLETLAEVCSILRLEMLEEHVHNNPDQLEAFGRVVWQLLQDVQERLVYRAHCYFETDILHYNPVSGDLAYPEKLEMMESIAQSMPEQVSDSQYLRRSESRSSVISLGSTTSQEVANINSGNSVPEQQQSRVFSSPADLHGMWYPTVRRTLVCLSRLYRSVDQHIFQGLSQEALSMCIQSISTAASAISERKTPLDGELFQIKHLLILREQIAPFQVDFTIKEMSLDFTKMKTAAFSLIYKRKHLFSLGTNNALLEFLLEGTPQVKERLVDSRKEVDKQLKSSCEAFINYASNMLASPILSFLQKAQTFFSHAAEMQPNTITLSQQPFASPQSVAAIVQDTQRLIKSKLPVIQRRMQLYLANRETEFILFRLIRNNVAASFVQLQQVMSNGSYSSDDLLVIGCPSPEQLLQAISHDDKLLRLQFCINLQNHLEDDFRKELIFKNGHATLEHVRDSLKVNVFCAISNKTVYGPFFFVERTVSGRTYLDMQQLEADSRDFIFQQGGARHISAILDEALLRWPPLSPDLMLCNFVLCGYVKNQVYGPPLPQNLDDLGLRITIAVLTVTPDMVARIWAEMDYRLERNVFENVEWGGRFFTPKWLELVERDDHNIGLGVLREGGKTSRARPFSANLML
ncbi:hypothetical protein PR048_027926 [Dryococelus australis]|uniref:Conserved oligomeric Golgi complex subunit 3 n=1 Tax=Dryococelus australis TaxID=614101 RepID=A0ABQ9GHX6_9NEOP|nr:hypothetical protein PR048_027926 [Dryococelus australis]